MSTDTKKKLPVSTLLLTKNSRKHLPAYFEATNWIDDIIMLDGFSDDGSKEYAAQFPQCQIHDQSTEYLDENNCINDFGGMRNYGYSFAKHPWIICIDSDEVPSSNFMESIQDIVIHGTPGVYTVTVNFLLKGKQIFTFRPVRQVRLFHKDAVVGCIKKVHERIEPLPGAHHGTIEGYITADMADYNIKKNYHYIEKELETLRPLGYKEWCRWILWFNVRSAFGRIAIAIINRCIPKKGPRFPWSFELKKLHYLLLLTWKTFPLWRKVYAVEATS